MPGRRAASRRPVRCAILIIDRHWRRQPPSSRRRWKKKHVYPMHVTTVRCPFFAFRVPQHSIDWRVFVVFSVRRSNFHYFIRILALACSAGFTCLSVSAVCVSAYDLANMVFFISSNDSAENSSKKERQSNELHHIDAQLFRSLRHLRFELFLSSLFYLFVCLL